MNDEHDVSRTRLVPGLGPVTETRLSVGAKLGMSGWDMLRIAPDIGFGSAERSSGVAPEATPTPSGEIELIGEDLKPAGDLLPANPIPNKVVGGPLW